MNETQTESCARCHAAPATTHQEYRTEGDRDHWANTSTDRCDRCAGLLRDHAAWTAQSATQRTISIVVDERIVGADPTPETIVVKLPATFWYDHVARGLPAGDGLGSSRSLVTVRLDAESYDEILDDARYYADHMASAGYTGQDARTVIGSARATVRRLEATPRPGGAKVTA